MRGINASGVPITVMAVDDSPVSRKMIKKALEPEGFQIVAEAGNGKQAVDLYPTAKPDVITMDVTMPIMDGLEAASAIKAINSSQRIVMLSAMGDDDIKNEARQRGIDAVCSKPFKPDDIIGTILSIL